MTKLALVTDTHWGCRNDSPLFADFISKFYKEVFFPYLEEHGIENIIHLGDIVDRRKYINFVTAKRLNDDFIEPVYKNKMNLRAIIGNHDTYFKNTNEINSMDVLYRESAHFQYHSSPTETTIDGCKILLMPWICDDNYEESMRMIEQTDAQVLFGHLEISGFEMYKGSVINHGMDRSTFDKFDVVCSGHYHHRSSRGNIHYLGCPYEMTWSDYNDPKGFHIFDTKTRELTFVPNSFTMFHKLVYDDTNKTIKDVIEQDFSVYKNTHLKVIVKNKNNPYWFDMMIDRLEKSGTANIQVVDDNLNLNLESDEDIVDEAEDTITILKKYVTNLEIETDKIELDNLMRSLYEEALSVE